MSLQNVYGIKLTGEKMITVPDFAVEEFETGESAIIKGDCHIHGAATCAALRGASSGVPVYVSSPLFTVVAGDKCWLVSPIAGKIHTIYIAPADADIVAALTGAFYTGDGVKATTVFSDAAVNQYYPQATAFDWTDADDLLFCTVGVGTSFYFSVTTTVGAQAVTVTAKIMPLVQGGNYG